MALMDGAPSKRLPRYTPQDGSREPEGPVTLTVEVYQDGPCWCAQVRGDVDTVELAPHGGGFDTYRDAALAATTFVTHMLYHLQREG